MKKTYKENVEISEDLKYFKNDKNTIFYSTIVDGWLQGLSQILWEKGYFFQGNLDHGLPNGVGILK